MLARADYHGRCDGVIALAPVLNDICVLGCSFVEGSLHKRAAYLLIWGLILAAAAEHSGQAHAHNHADHHVPRTRLGKRAV